MGITYTGLYADFLDPPGVWHEVYAARRMPDCTLTGNWNGGPPVTGHVALEGACTCGWHSDAQRSPGGYESQAFFDAQRDAETMHLDPLVADAERRFWPTWAQRMTRAADAVDRHMAAGNTRSALEILTEMGAWMRAATRVANETHVANDTPAAQPEHQARPAAAFPAPGTPATGAGPAPPPPAGPQQPRRHR